MSCVHFKFKSSLDYEKVTFDGLHISLSELREAIMKQKKIGLSNEFKLEVVDAQSKKVYNNDSEMIPRNSSVVVRRVPIPNAPKLPKTQHKDPSLIPQATASDTKGKLSADGLRKVADLSTADASEEEKLMAMISQSGEGFDPSQYAKAQRFAGPGAHPGLRNPPPPNYICHRCGQKGHWIKFCPTNGNPTYDRLPYKRSIGIPSTHVSLAKPGMPGAMMNRFGDIVVRTVDINAMKTGKVKSKGEALEAPEEVEVPKELTCPLCKELVKDAVTIPCCGESFCDNCIRDHLLENEFTCPACKEEDVSPDTLAPNKELRTAAKDFRSKAAERKSVAMARGFVGTVTPHQSLVGSRGFARPSLPGPTTTQTPVSTVTTTAPLRSSRVSIVRSTPLTSSASTPAPLTTATPSLPTSTPVPPTSINAPPMSNVAPPTSTIAPPTSTTVVTSSTRDSTVVTSDSQKHDEAKSSSDSLVNGVVTSTSKLDSTPPADESSAPPTLESQPEPAGPSLTVPGQESASNKAPRSRSPSPARSTSPRPAASVATGSKVADPSTGIPRPALVTSAVLPRSIPPALLGTVLPPPALLVNQLAAIGSAPLPGLMPVLSAPPVMPGLSLPGVLAPPPTSTSSSSKLDRIAADLLLSSASMKSSRSASPPLTAEEFYRQQKMLKHLVFKKKTSLSPDSSSYSSSSESRSSSSFSRTGSYSGSSRSQSYTRSRSRSPVHSKHRSSKKLKHDRRERYEKEHERTRHVKRKRKRHDSVEAVEHHSRKTKRHRSKSPMRKKVPPEPLLSPGISTSTGTSENEHKSRRHRHKKRRKRRHQDAEMEDEAITVSPTEEAISPRTADNQAVSSEPELAPGESVGVPLVPYQDSSATDVDRREESELNSEASGPGAVAMEEEEQQQQEAEKGQRPPQPSAVQDEDAQLLAELEDAITLHVDETFDGVGTELGLIQEAATPTPSPSVNSAQTKEDGEISDSEEDSTATEQLGEAAIPAPETERLIELTPKLGKEDKTELENDEAELKKDEAESEMEEEEKVADRVVSMSKGHSVASAVLMLPAKSDLSSAFTGESDDVHTRHREKRKHKSKDKHDPRKKKKKSRKHELELTPAHKPSRKLKHETKSRKHKKSSHSDRHRH